VVPVGEVQAALEQIGLGGMLLELTLLLCCQQPYDRRKIVFLVEVEEDLAVMRLLYDDGLGVILAGKNRPRRRQGRQDQKTADYDDVASDQ
jgi:hypothetical protein